MLWMMIRWVRAIWGARRRSALPTKPVIACAAHCYQCVTNDNRSVSTLDVTQLLRSGLRSCGLPARGYPICCAIVCHFNWQPQDTVHIATVSALGADKPAAVFLCPRPHLAPWYLGWSPLFCLPLIGDGRTTVVSWLQTWAGGILLTMKLEQ